MKSTLSTGLSATRSLVVDTERTIDFLGEALRVYATPALVRDFEYACREFLLDHLDAGEDSVGTGISVSHEGATLRGMNVQITVTVAKIEGRLVTFTLHARDDVEQISQGSHSRFVVEVEKLRSRVAAKANKVGKPSASN
ncbi:MAG TPA: thioesterase family protein [Burkholderiaceae bacterium]|nr:thioesterase family protein [Burkholderiaceae bacterium]